MTKDDDCTTCATSGRRGYCAPARCYCGHPACHAFASWVDLSAVRPPDTAQRAPDTRQRDSWANREGETWLERL